MSSESRKLALYRSTTDGTISPKNFRQLSASVLAVAIICIVLSGCTSDVAGPAGPTVNNDVFSSVTVAASSASSTGVFTVSSSSVPDASNQFIYFVANGPHGAGVFKVPATGGTATEVSVGAPFSAPVDIALSTDNQMLFVADSAAGGTGRIFSLSINGGTPTEVSGTAGTMPVAVDVIQRSGQDIIYFCGTNAADGQKAIFEVPSTGGSLVVRYKGGALVSPGGIVSAKDGTLYIADRAGMVHKLSGTTLTQIASGIIMGTPPGITLTPDDKTLAVSSKSSANGTAQVEIIDLQTGSKSVFNKVIGVNPGAGGLHAARNAQGATGVYSWCGTTTGNDGVVFRVRLD